MADAAEELQPDAPDNVVALPGADAPIGLKRKAEGGLALHFTFDIPKLPSMNRVTSWTHQQMINGGLVVAVALLAGWTVYQAKFAPAATPAVETRAEAPTKTARLASVGVGRTVSARSIQPPSPPTSS